MQAELLKLIENFDVISFDVFDTLLLRPYLTQEDLWRCVGKVEVKGGAAFAMLRRARGGQWSDCFLKTRVEADRKTYEAATRRGGEHTIDEAYARMPRRYAELQEKEESLQRECLAVNPEMMEVWKRAGELGKKRIIVSDMYLSEAWFAETLREKGFGAYDALYVSSARQARKSTGKLFEIVRADFQGKKILHIGDNAQSDVAMAKVAGFSAWHYPNLRDELFGVCPFLQEYQARWPRFEKRLQVGALVRGYKIAGGSAKSYWWRLGYFFGGVLGHLYVTWLAEQTKARGIDHLMFVARDGYLWKRMFDSLGTCVRTDYFYAPRMTSVKVCGVVGTDPNAMEERRKILEGLPDNDPLAERARYRTYLDRFAMTGKTALVDGCSSAFSVQRLVEAACGRSVPTFYLRAMSPLMEGAALYERSCNCAWQMLSEFLFSSPERPIDDVDAGGPKYRETIMDAEEFRLFVFDDVAEGTVAGFHVLQDAARGTECLVSRQDWLDYFAAFQANLTAEDVKNLERAQNAWQIRQENFSPIVMRGVCSRVTRRFGIPLGVWRGRALLDGYEERFYALGRWPVVTRRF